MVKESMDNRGWQQVPFEQITAKYNLRWVERRSQIDYKTHTAGMLVNHIINNEVFTTKQG